MCNMLLRLNQSACRMSHLLGLAAKSVSHSSGLLTTATTVLAVYTTANQG